MLESLIAWDILWNWITITTIHQFVSLLYWSYVLLPFLFFLIVILILILVIIFLTITYRNCIILNISLKIYLIIIHNSALIHWYFICSLLASRIRISDIYVWRTFGINVSLWIIMSIIIFLLIWVMMIRWLWEENILQ